MKLIFGLVERDLKTIDSLPEEKLRPEFVEGMTSLKNKVFETVKPKTIMGKKLSGVGNSSRHFLFLTNRFRFFEFSSILCRFNQHRRCS